MIKRLLTGVVVVASCVWAQTPPASAPASAPVGTGRVFHISDAKKVAAVPDVELSDWTLKFEAQTLDGQTVRMPDDFKGKLVALLVTSGRNAEEVDKQREHWKFAAEAYSKLPVAFLEIIADPSPEASAVKARDYVKANATTWPVIYEGGAALCAGLGVQGVPVAFLVNGDTGGVLYYGNSLKKRNFTKRLRLLLGLGPAPKIERKIPNSFGHLTSDEDEDDDTVAPTPPSPTPLRMKPDGSPPTRRDPATGRDSQPGGKPPASQPAGGSKP
jgi:hypothetical protein